MAEQPKAPQTFDDFVARFPELAKAWELVHDAQEQCKLDPKTARLVKLGIAIGAQREGAVRASARKAASVGLGEDELYQVVTLAAGTVGFPSSVAAFAWIRDALTGK